MLAPMDGISVKPFRILTRQLGSSMSYTEFINATDVINNHPHLEEKLSFCDIERPIVFQIFDDNPDRIYKAALILQERNPDIIDINMGCPAKSVSSRGAGAGLLRNPKIIATIFQKLSNKLDIPITGKIRLGWDDTSRNYLEISHIIEDNGGQLIAVHARTKAQAYSGMADWDAIAEIKNIVSIPVIGNGNIRTLDNIVQMKSHTNCDGVMIAREALSNPWIFSNLDRQQVSTNLLFKTMNDHLRLMLEFFGCERGIFLFRKHAVYYLKPYSIPSDLKFQLLTCKSENSFLIYLDQIYKLISN